MKCYGTMFGKLKKESIKKILEYMEDKGVDHAESYAQKLTENSEYLNLGVITPYIHDAGTEVEVQD